MLSAVKEIHSKTRPDGTALFWIRVSLKPSSFSHGPSCTNLSSDAWAAVSAVGFLTVGRKCTVVGVLSSPLEDFQLGVYGDRSLIRANVSYLLFKSGH